MEDSSKANSIVWDLFKDDNFEITFFEWSGKFFCPDAMYWSGWTSIFLLVNLTNLLNIEQIFDRTEQMSDEDAMLNCSRYFLDCLRSGSIGAEGADAEIACTGGTCARYIYVGDAYIGDACIRSTCVGGAYVGIISIIKCLGIYLQLSQISEVKLL